MSPIRESSVEFVAGELATYRVVDVREPAEFHGPLGHVEGAVLCPLGSLPEALDGTDPAHRLLLVCRSGRRSRDACERLEAAGFRDVTNLAGGMIAWNEAGLPVQRSKVESIGDVLERIVVYFSQVTAATPAEVESTLRALIEAAGSSFEDPSGKAVERALLELAESARQPKPPADLALVVEACRRDLAEL